MELHDDDCAFCRHWIEKWRTVFGERGGNGPYQQALAGYPRGTEKQCREAGRLILPEGTAYSGAQAAFVDKSIWRHYWCLISPVFAGGAMRLVKNVYDFSR